MPEAPEIKVKLTAEDTGVAAAIKELSSQLKSLKNQQDDVASSAAKTGSAFRSMVDSVKLRLANFPGLGNFGSMASLRAYEPIGKMLEKSADSLDTKFGAAGEAMLGFTGAAIAVGAAALGITSKMLDLAQSVENVAAATGLSTDQVQEFTEIAKEMNLDAGSLESAFARINSQLGEFVATGSATGSGSQFFVKVLKDMNVALVDASGNLRPVNDILGDFYEQLQKIPDPTKRSAIEMAALGTRGRVIAQMFAEAQREGISYRDMLKKVDESGVVLTSDQVAGLEQTKGKWDEVGRSIRGAWTQLKLFTSQAVTHPLSTAANLAGSGFVGGLAITNATVGAGAKTGAPGPGGPAGTPQEVLSANQAEIEKLAERVALLKAGGAMQLQLEQAEVKYAAAVKQGHADAAAQYKQEIVDLKQIIALESEKKVKHGGDKSAEEAARRKEAVAKAFERVQTEGEESVVRWEEKEKEMKQRAEERDERNARTRLEFEQKILAAEGETYAQAIVKINEEAEAYRKAGGTAAEVNKFITQETAQAKFKAAAGDMEQGLKSFGIQKQSVEIGAKSGKTGKLAAEREINQLIAQRLPLLEQQAQAELAAAQAAGNQDDIAKAQNDIIQVQNLKAQTSSLAQQMRGPVSQSFTNFFETVGHGTETVQRSFENLAGGIIAALQKVLMQKLMEKILGTDSSDSGGSGAGAGFSGLLGGLFASMGSGHAEGGLIRGRGGPKADAIPAMLSDGEYVISAAAVAAFGAHNLEAINRGMRIPSIEALSSRTVRFAEGGLVGPSSSEPSDIRLAVGLDHGLVLQHLSSKAAGRVILQHLVNNPKAASKATSRGR